MIQPLYYHTVYIWALFILCLIYVLTHYSISNKRLLKKENNLGISVVLGIIVILFLGLRPLEFAHVFGDTFTYLHMFNLLESGIGLTTDHDKEWLFRNIMEFFSATSTASNFFLFIEFIYVSGYLWAAKRIIPNNPYLALLIILTSFSFYAYGINGIRNGMACSIICVGLSFITGNKRDRIFAILCCFFAVAIHASTILPATMMFISVYFIKDFKWALGFWITAIFVSLFAGNSISSLSIMIGFDDRMTSYLTQSPIDGKFSHTGFRWDFLIYSAIPIFIGYYAIVKKRIEDKKYIILLNTYILCNAFWVIVIRASFNNRFAYLSWFMYPLVLAYPFLRLNIWNNQSKKLAIAIMGNVLFSILI